MRGYFFILERGQYKKMLILLSNKENKIISSLEYVLIKNNLMNGILSMLFVFFH